MEGYWQALDETANVLREGAYLTGDLARRDSRGLLYIVGRCKQMIKAGGHRVSPQEIEDALCEHDAVAEVAVIGVPDELMGARLKAFVVARAGTELDPRALVQLNRGESRHGLARRLFFAMRR